MSRRKIGDKDYDHTWWPEFWKKRYSKYSDLPKPTKILDFKCINECNITNGNDITTFMPPEEGDVNKPEELHKLPFEDDTFDAIVFHSSINKSGAIKLNSVKGLPLGKACSIIGSNWMLKEHCKARWTELYRVTKDKGVFFISCYKHHEHHKEVEKILTDDDRCFKKIRVEGW